MLPKYLNCITSRNNLFCMIILRSVLQYVPQHLHPDLYTGKVHVCLWHVFLHSLKSYQKMFQFVICSDKWIEYFCVVDFINMTILRHQRPLKLMRSVVPNTTYMIKSSWNFLTHGSFLSTVNDFLFHENSNILCANIVLW